MIGVATEGFDMAATDLIDLSSLGAVTGLTFSRNEKGDEACNFGLDLPIWYDHPGLQLRRRLIVHLDGFTVWQGVADRPVKDSPWQVSTVGLGPWGAANASAVFSSAPSLLTHQSNDIVDEAIDRGVLPWWRPSDLPDLADDPPTYPGQVGDYLDLVSAGVGQQWEVDSFGNVTFAARPTSPVWLVDAIDVPGGISLADYYTVATGRYYTSTNTIEVTTVQNDFWVNLGYVVEKPVDLTGYGPLDAGTVDAILANLLTMTAPRPTFTGSVTVHRGHLLSLGGVPAELAVARANQMYRFVGVQPDSATGVLDIGGDMDVLIGGTSYSADEDTLTLTPLASSPTDLDEILTDLLARRFRQPISTSVGG